jgi:dienelactone hydrolase
MNPICIAFALSAAVAAGAQVKDLNTPRTFPEIESKTEWRERAQEIREHVLMSCGLWPMPPKTPLNAKVFDRVERDGYSIEKVYFETYPGFYLAGNLYRPLGKGKGPHPGVLNPHGHWSNGRLADAELGSIAARCINFARQGMVAFSYDMAGYNDTRQVDHRFASNPTNLLWNISLMGLQTWNTVRALDFLESLPDVDRKRLACTGESGGGTQTFMLAAIDDRLAATGPIVMVSHSMQGGCLCENAPGLRVDYSNMEIAAAAAPLPQVIVAATGDWTKKMLEVEGPAIASVYELFGKTNRFHYSIFDYPHNYNRTSREAVYASFNEWLLRRKGAVPELPYKKEPDTDLLVFRDGLPPGALNEAALIGQLVNLYRKQIDDLKPGSSRWRQQMTPAWEHALNLQHVRFAAEDSREMQGQIEKVVITREPEAARVRLEINPGKGPVVLLLGDQPQIKRALEEQGITVVTTDAASAPFPEDQVKNFYSTYNRTWTQKGAADIKAASDYLSRRFRRSKIVLVADARSAGAALLSAPLVNGVIADVSDLSDATDEALLRPNSFSPGLRRIGSFQGVLALERTPVLLHGAKDTLATDWLPKKQVRSTVANPDEMLEYIRTSVR